MQRTRAAGSGHASRLVAKKIWRARSKSQSRASPATTSIWTPMGGNTWSSVTGRVVTVEKTTLLHLTELERLTLQQVALVKLQALSLGCSIRLPAEQTGSGGQKKRRPYLLKRKALTTGIFDNKKEEVKDGVEGGQVFGLSLNKCLENERSRSREAAERAATAAAAAAAMEEGGPDSPLCRKLSQTGSHASISSLVDGAKQSSTGSLESLNLERKRPSLAGSGGGGSAGGGAELGLSPAPLTPDLLTVEGSPQIPGLVSTCLRHLETTGLHTLGLFRVSSSKKRVRQLREEFDKGREVWLSDDHCPHDVATLLKEFFRDLPEPLLTRELYEPFIKTQKIRNRKLQFEALQHLVQLMPVANRDTLYSLLTFLATVAEHSTDRISETGEMLQGNKMDSSNLATLFAPNILHTVRAGGEGQQQYQQHQQHHHATHEMALQAEEVINVVRAMIDHNKALFEVPSELLDETYQHLMDTHPEALDILLRRRCTGADDRGQHLQELLACLLQPHRSQNSPSHTLELEVDTSSSVYEGSECSASLPRSPTDAALHHDFDRRRAEEDEDGRGRRRREAGVVEASGSSEERGWFRRRDKSSSREQDRGGGDERADKTRWFRKREKSTSRVEARREDHDLARQREKARKGEEAWERRRGGRMEDEVEQQLRVPEVTQRRLSSPEIDHTGVITASLRIPVPLSQTPRAPTHAHADAPEDPDDKKNRQRTTSSKSSGSGNGRQRSGSSDSYLGQPITGTMSFQPLSKKSDRQSHDSVLSSSSADVFTLSPSPRNTPLSDMSPSGASSPLSRTGSPPPWLSPDSGTPGLSPPNSPPVHIRRPAQTHRGPTVEPPGMPAHPEPHGIQGATARTPAVPPRTRVTSPVVPQGVFPIGRSRTVDSFQTTQGEATTGEGRGISAARRYTRRRYTGERHPTGHLPDLSGHGGEASGTGAEGHAQLWKRWEIIASDPTEPETFV